MERVRKYGSFKFSASIRFSSRKDLQRNIFLSRERRQRCRERQGRGQAAKEFEDAKEIFVDIPKEALH